MVCRFFFGYRPGATNCDDRKLQERIIVAFVDELSGNKTRNDKAGIPESKSLKKVCLLSFSHWETFSAIFTFKELTFDDKNQ